MEWNGSKCEATDLGWDFWPNQLQFYHRVFVTALITLLTYPVSTYKAECSFSSMKWLQTPLRRWIVAGRNARSLVTVHYSASCFWGRQQSREIWNRNKVPTTHAELSRTAIQFWYRVGKITYLINRNKVPRTHAALLRTEVRFWYRVGNITYFGLK